MGVWRAFATLGFAACGLFPDLGSLEGDASTDASQLDVSSKDVSDPLDAAGDAGVDAPADVVTSPCKVAHTFCDDFDTPPLAAKWDGIKVTSGPVVLSTNAITPPNSLEATANSSGSQSMLYKSFPAADHSRVELDVLVQPPADTTSTEVDMVNFELAVAPAGYSYGNFNLQRYLANAQIEQYAELADGGGTSQDLPLGNDLTAWHHVALDLDFTAQKLIVSIDGAVIKTLSFNPPVVKTGFQLQIGVSYAEAHDTWNVFIDDLTVDQQ